MASRDHEATSKSGPPVKKSIFERQKAEADAKKAREKAETAAVYEDFVKSFEEEEDDYKAPPAKNIHGASVGFASGPGKRHFTSSGLKSGPGSLGPIINAPKSENGSFGSSTYLKKRQFDDFSGRHNGERSQGALSYDDREGKEQGRIKFEREAEKDDGELKAASKPTLHLSSLPPGTSTAVIKGLLTPALTVENVRILNSSSDATERKSTSAIVALAAETPAAEIETTVSHLQNKYMGFGFNLSLSRHLSSGVLSGAGALGTHSKSASSLPFGARPIPQNKSLSRAPPPGHTYGRFAPPASYTSSVPYGSRPSAPSTQVVVQTPSDLKQLKLIHKMLEALLTYGPEFEALLMSRPQIQKDEQWAWLWDSRSVGGIYYRWRLWEILTNANSRRKDQRVGYTVAPSVDVLFSNQSPWLPPEDSLKFEFTTRLDDFINDDDYNSSDEEDEEEGGIARRYNDHNMSGTIQTTMVDVNDGAGYLNPLAKTKLIHLLSRLPENNAKLRKGDVARITGFAIEHAGAGAEEIAMMVTRNIIRPFCHVTKDSDQLEKYEGEARESKLSLEKPDLTPASLVGLYIISDILSSSASAGVRHAWRYRALFETALRQQKVLEKIGRADRDHGWGKLKAEKWKRSIHSILSLWETWCVFPQASHEEFVNSFDNPPLTEKEQALAEIEEKRKNEDEARRTKNNNRWRNVEADEKALPSSNGFDALNGKMTDGIDGAPMGSDDNEMDIDEPEDIGENIDGVPMEDSDEDQGPETPGKTSVEPISINHSAVDTDMKVKRQRPKAVDMFADESD